MNDLGQAEQDINIQIENDEEMFITAYVHDIVRVMNM